MRNNGRRHDSKWINRDLVPTPYIGFCQSKNSFLKECKKLRINNPPDWVTQGANGTTHSFYCKDKDAVIVCIEHDPKRRPSEIIALVVHEAVHVWQGIRDRMGEVSPSSEFEAYSIQSISMRMLEAYKPKIYLKQ